MKVEGRQFIKVAFRNFQKHKASVTINILGLAIGMCACFAIYQIANFELSYDSTLPDRNRIFRLVSDFQQSGGEINYWGTVPPATTSQLSISIPDIDAITNFYIYKASVKVMSQSSQRQTIFIPLNTQNNSDIIFADSSYFEIFKYLWIAGNPTSALKDPFRVVLTESVARKYFGAADYNNMIGREIVYNYSVHVRVAGIVKDLDRNTDLTFGEFLSFNTLKTGSFKKEIDFNDWHTLKPTSQVFVRLAKGANENHVRSGIQQFCERYIHFDTDQKYHMHMQPFSDLHFNSMYGKDYGRQAHLPTIYGLMAIAWFILIIAAINFINLSIAQSLQRTKEVGVRKILGSSRANLIFQHFIETLMLAFVAFVIAVILVRPFLNILPGIIPKELTLNIWTFKTLFFSTMIILVTALISGIYPAWIISSYSPVAMLKNDRSNQLGRRNRFRNGLIVFQFTISIVFIISGIAVNRQLKFLLEKDMGFTKNAIINFRLETTDDDSKKHILAERLKRLSGVETVSINWFQPVMQGPASTTINYKGSTDEKISAGFRFGDENYIPLYKMKLVAGRNIRYSDTLHELVINETCAKVLGFNNPQEAISQIVDMWGRKCPIVGVVSDFNSKPLTDSMVPMVIGSMDKFATNFSVRLQLGDNKMNTFQNTISKIQSVWTEIYPNQAFDYSFFDETVAGFYDKEQNTRKLVTAAMIIATIISSMGLFSLVKLVSAQRIREIGIRKVLGASVSGIVSLISGEFLGLVCIAILIASPIAWYGIQKWLQQYIQRISLDWSIFTIAGVVALLIAFITMSLHVIRIATLNPNNAIRNDQ